MPWYMTWNRLSSISHNVIAGGYYCTAGTVWPSTPCAHGYYCRTGATQAAPDQATDANICPEGYYCEEGTAEPVPCPQGTYSNITGLGNLTQCTNCDPGMMSHNLFSVFFMFAQQRYNFSQLLYNTTLSMITDWIRKPRDPLKSSCPEHFLV